MADINGWDYDVDLGENEGWGDDDLDDLSVDIDNNENFGQYPPMSQPLRQEPTIFYPAVVTPEPEVVVAAPQGSDVDEEGWSHDDEDIFLNDDEDEENEISLEQLKHHVAPLTIPVQIEDSGVIGVNVEEALIEEEQLERPTITIREDIKKLPLPQSVLDQTTANDDSAGEWDFEDGEANDEEDDDEEEDDVDRVQLQKHTLPLTRPFERARSCSVSVEDELLKEEALDKTNYLPQSSSEEEEQLPFSYAQSNDPLGKTSYLGADGWEMDEDELEVEEDQSVNEQVFMSSEVQPIDTESTPNDIKSTIDIQSTPIDIKSTPIEIQSQPITTLAPPGEREVVDKVRAVQIVNHWNQTAYLKVVKLDLSNKSYTFEATTILAEYFEHSNILANVSTVNISDVIAGRMEQEGLQVLQLLSKVISKQAPLIQTLDLSDNAMGSKGIDACQTFLTQCAHLNSLRLCNNGLSEHTMHQVVDLLIQNGIAPRLRTIHFYNNMSGHGGCVAFARLLATTDFETLSDIRFSGTRADHKGTLTIIKAMAKHLFSQTTCALESLDLADNILKIEGGTLLAESVLGHCANLRHLDLADCLLEDDGVIAVCHVLQKKCPSVEFINLSGNDMTAKGAINGISSLIKFMPNLKTLVLQDNELTSRGVSALANAIPDASSLINVNLSNTLCGIIGANSWHEARSKLPNIQSLDMDGNFISEDLVACLSQSYSDAWKELTDNNPGEPVDDELSDEEAGEAEAHVLKERIANEASGATTEIEVFPLMEQIQEPVLQIINQTLKPPGDREVVDERIAHLIVNYWTRQMSQSPLITFLDLSNKSYTAQAARVLTEYLSRIMENVTTVNVSDIIASQMEQEGLEVLETFASAIARNSPLLQCVDLSDNALGSKGIDACRALFTECTHLHTLKLCNNGLSEYTMHHVVDLLVENGLAPRLRSIHLFNNMSGNGGCQAFARLLKNCSANTLEQVRFSGTRADRQGSMVVVQAMVEMIQDFEWSVNHLDLADNTLGVEGGTLLAQQVLAKCPKLKFLNVADCCLQDDGVIAICNALVNCPIRDFNVSGNEVTYKGANMGLVPLLSKLERLIANENDLDSRGVSVLAKSIPDQSILACLDLSSNHCGARGAKALIETSHNFRTLNLDGNMIPCDCIEQLQKRFGDSLLEMPDNDPDENVDDDLSEEEIEEHLDLQREIADDGFRKENVEDGADVPLEIAAEDFRVNGTGLPEKESPIEETVESGEGWDMEDDFDINGDEDEAELESVKINSAPQSRSGLVGFLTSFVAPLRASQDDRWEDDDDAIDHIEDIDDQDDATPKRETTTATKVSVNDYTTGESLESGNLSVPDGEGSTDNPIEGSEVHTVSLAQMILPAVVNSTDVEAVAKEDCATTLNKDQILTVTDVNDEKHNTDNSTVEEAPTSEVLAESSYIHHSLALGSRSHEDGLEQEHVVDIELGRENTEMEVLQEVDGIPALTAEYDLGDDANDNVPLSERQDNGWDGDNDFREEDNLVSETCIKKTDLPSAENTATAKPPAEQPPAETTDSTPYENNTDLEAANCTNGVRAGVNPVLSVMSPFTQPSTTLYQNGTRSHVPLLISTALQQPIDYAKLYQDEVIKTTLLEAHVETLNKSVSHLESLQENMEKYYRDHDEETQYELEQLTQEIQNLRIEICQLQTINEERDREALALRSCVQQKEDQVDQMNEKIADLQQNAQTHLVQERRAWNDEMDRLKQENDSQVKELTLALKQIQEQYNLGEQQFIELRDERDRMAQNLHATSEECRLEKEKALRLSQELDTIRSEYLRRQEDSEVSTRREIEEKQKLHQQQLDDVTQKLNKTQAELEKIILTNTEIQAAHEASIEEKDESHQGLLGELRRKLEETQVKLDISVQENMQMQATQEAKMQEKHQCHQRELYDINRKLQVVQAELDKSLQSNMQMQATQEVLMAEMATSDNQSVALEQSQKHVKQLQVQVNILETQVKDAQANTAEAINQLQEAEATVAVSIQTESNLESQIYELRQKIDQLLQINHVLHNEKMALEIEITKLQESLSSISKESRSTSEELEPLRRLKKEMEETIQGLQEQVNNITSERNSLSEENEELLVQLALESQAQQRLEQQIAEYSTYLEEQKHLSLREKNILEGQLTKMSDELQQLRTELEVDKNLSSTTSKNLELEVAQLQGKLKESETKSEGLARDKESLESDCESYIKQVSELEKALQSKLEDQNSIRAGMQARIESLSNECDFKEKLLTDMRSEHQNAAEQIQQLSFSENQYREELSGLRQHIDSLKKQLEAQQASQSDNHVTQRLMFLDGELHRLTEILHERDSEINNLRHELSERSVEVEDKKKQIEDLEHSILAKELGAIAEEDGWADTSSTSLVEMQLQEDVKVLRAEVGKLKEELKHKSRTIDSLISEKERLLNSNSDVEEQLQMLNTNFSEESESQMEAIWELQDKLAEEEKQRALAEAKAKELEKQVHIAISRRTNESEIENETIKSLEIQLQGAHSSIKKWEDALNDKENALEAQQSEIDNLTKQLFDLRSELESTTSSITEKQNLLDDAYKKIASFDSILDQHTSTIEELKFTKQSLLQELASQEMELQRMRNAGVRMEIPKDAAESIDFMREKIIALATALERSEHQRAEAMERLSSERHASADSLRRVGENVKKLYSTFSVNNSNP